MEYMKEYHILTGDALKDQFPKEIEGEIIIARECLVDGPVNSVKLDQLFDKRAAFISEFYGDYSKEDYFKESASELLKIKDIPEGSTINLWFEDDLFCQVNFWFVSYLILNFTAQCKVFLVRPKQHTQYGFGGLNQDELVDIFNHKIELKRLVEIASLWEHYQQDDLEKLLKVSRDLQSTYPFILI
jgi:hypothetical protein